MPVRIIRKNPSMTQYAAAQALRRIERELAAIIFASPAWTGTLPPVQDHVEESLSQIRALYNLRSRADSPDRKISP